MYVYLKQSGELLTDPTAESPWNAKATALSAERIAEVHRSAGDLGIQGLMVVSGAGNVVRGAGLKNEFDPASRVQRVADAIGRLGTLQNTIILSAQLSDLGVPNKVFMAPGMHLYDKALEGVVNSYGVRRKERAYADGEVVLIAGGDGRDGHTTDTAVFRYAEMSAFEHTQTSHRVLKATAFNGVYDADPRHNANAQRYGTISAGHMLGDYERYAAVDQECLDGLVDTTSNLGIQIYSANEYTPLQALSDPNGVGTLITPGYAKPVYA